jgi:hypothetical protein
VLRDLTENLGGAPIASNIELPGREAAVEQPSPGPVGEPARSDSGSTTAASHPQSDRPALRNIAPGKLAYEVADLTEGLELRHGTIGNASLVFARLGSLGAEAGIRESDRWFCTSDYRFLKGFRELCYKRLGRGPGESMVAEAIAHLEARGFGCEREPVASRIAAKDGAIWLSLGPATNEVVKITPVGWEVVEGGPVLFRHADNADTLPIPARGGSVDLLRRHLPNVSDAHWPALVGFIVATFVPEGAFPILCLSGPPESGKSFTTELVRAICDPVVGLDARGEFPEKEEDLFTIASGQHVLSFDNLSRVDADISDALCCLTTGAARQVRLLYSQGSLHTLRVRNPVVLNGITPGIQREDLVSRSIFIEHELPPDAKRKESQVRREFRQDLPLILGAILDAVALALRDGEDTTVTPRHRLEDAACFATAAEPALGFADGAIVAAWKSSQETTHADLCGADPVVEGITRVIKGSMEWSGTATDLLAQARDTESGHAGMPLSKDFPRTASGLGDALKRKTKILEQAGYVVEKERGRDKRRITITRQVDLVVAAANGRQSPVVKVSRPQRPPSDDAAAVPSAPAEGGGKV